MLLAQHWDYASRFSTAGKCATWLQTLMVDGKKPLFITIAITGMASPRCLHEMEKRGFRRWIGRTKDRSIDNVKMLV